MTVKYFVIALSDIRVNYKICFLSPKAVILLQINRIKNNEDLRVEFTKPIKMILRPILRQGAITAQG